MEPVRLVMVANLHYHDYACLVSALIFLLFVVLTPVHEFMFNSST